MVVMVVVSPRRTFVLGLSTGERRLYRRQCALSFHLGYGLLDPRVHSLQSSGIYLLLCSQFAFALNSFAAATLAAAGTTKVAD